MEPDKRFISIYPPQIYVHHSSSLCVDACLFVGHVLPIPGNLVRSTENAHGSSVMHMITHPTRHLLFSGSADHTIRIWNSQTGQPISTLKGLQFLLLIVPVVMPDFFFSSGYVVLIQSFAPCRTYR